MKRERLIMIDWLVFLVELDLDHWRELSFKRVQIYQILDAMKNYWGGFAKRLWESLEYADWENTQRIIETWSDMIIRHLHLNGFWDDK